MAPLLPVESPPQLSTAACKQGFLPFYAWWERDSSLGDASDMSNLMGQNSPSGLVCTVAGGSMGNQQNLSCGLHRIPQCTLFGD